MTVKQFLEIKGITNKGFVCSGGVNFIEELLNQYREVLESKKNNPNDRYDSLKFKPPFRVGKKQGKAVLDSLGLLVTVLENDVQAILFCEYLNEKY